MTGQLVAALANPFALDAPTKVCAVWFSDAERLTANTAMSLAQFVGTAVVLGAAPAIVAENPENVEKLNLITFLMCLVLGLPSLIARNKPPFPPSKSAASAELKSMPFIQGLKSLLTNSQFILMFIIFGVIIGAFECYVTLISDYVVPYGYTEADAGWLEITTIACGTVASILLGGVFLLYLLSTEEIHFRLILDRTKSHKIFLKILTVVTFLGALGFYYSATRLDRRALLFISAAVIGIGGFPLTPIALELGVECTYPVAEGTSAGLLHTSVQILGTVILVVSNVFREGDGKLEGALIWLVVVIGICVLLAPFYTATSRRMEMERESSPPGPLEETVSMDIMTSDKK